MSRFAPIIKISWLVCKRNGLPRDLRIAICQYIKLHIFDWETQQLINERCFFEYFDPQRLARHLFVTNLPQIVETCDSGVEEGLSLQRVIIRPNKFLSMKKMWIWLRK